MCKSCAEKNGSKAEGTVKEKRGTKLLDSKPLGGKGHLTQSEINKLQSYYGLVIRRNVSSLEAMKRGVWAVFLSQAVKK
jgi:hypothetical protein